MKTRQLLLGLALASTLMPFASAHADGWGFPIVQFVVPGYYAPQVPVPVYNAYYRNYTYPAWGWRDHDRREWRGHRDWHEGWRDGDRHDGGGWHRGD